MKTYEVEITETLQMTVEVEARSRQEAERIVAAQWKEAEYILDADSFKGVTFRVVPREREYGER